VQAIRRARTGLHDDTAGMHPDGGGRRCPGSLAEAGPLVPAGGFTLRLVLVTTLGVSLGKPRPRRQWAVPGALVAAVASHAAGVALNG